MQHEVLNEVPTTSELEEISKLADRQLLLEGDLAHAEKLVERVKLELRAISEVALPEAMRAVGLRAFTLANGAKITVKDDMYCSIRKEHESAAFSWLRERGFGDIIKTQVAVSFGKGDVETASTLAMVLSNQGYDVDQKASVHASTLKAFAKEQLSEGRALPDDLFSTASVQRAVIKTL